MKKYRSENYINPLKDFKYISLHINSNLGWKEVRNILNNWTKKFDIDLSEKILLFYLIDFYECQKYGQPSELIKYINSLGGGQTNYYEDSNEKLERLKMLFENLNHHKGLALFIGPFNDELQEEWSMVDLYADVYSMQIDND